jgi:hypothetical protein
MTNRSQPTKADLAFQSRMEKLSRLHQTPPTTNRNQNATKTSICALHSIALVFGITPPYHQGWLTALLPFPSGL